MKSILIAAFLLPSSASANPAADELLAAFQSRMERGDSIDDICDSLERRESAVLNALIADLGNAWPPARERYLSALNDSTKKGASPGRGDTMSEIRRLRAELVDITAMDEAAMKPLLLSSSEPGLGRLRKLLHPTPDELAAEPPLSQLRETAIKLARFRDAALNAALSSTPADSLASLSAQEDLIATEAANLPRDGLRILQKNRQIAASKEIPADEALGIEELNHWRLYLGLNALELDPKLCEAARDHSKDMTVRGFFAHESPVHGKTTPGDRARRFGTNASGENIYMGSADPRAANHGWFLSPGHHKNLFNSGHRRIGLGRHERHWTQLFGR